MLMYSISFLAVVAVYLCQIPSARCQYQPSIPAGYTESVVMHVGYGNAPDKIPLRLGGGDTDATYEGDPASVREMQVTKDAIYFLDDVGFKVKKYGLSGKLIWETEPFFNLSCYVATPANDVYVVWGDGVNQLSRLSEDGRTTWTKSLGSLLTKDRLADLGMRSASSSILDLRWTIYGLTLRVSATDQEGVRNHLLLAVDESGDLIETIQGTFVASNGVAYGKELYDAKWDKAKSRPSSLTVPGRGKNLASSYRVTLDFASASEQQLRGLKDTFGVGRVMADINGGFLVDSRARLESPVRINSSLTANMEHVLWRFDSSGKLVEQWRFPATPYARSYPPITVGSDGSIYYLRFGDTGIEVVKYKNGQN